MTSLNRDKACYSQGVLSIIVNIGLFILKFWAGIVSGSLALTADAWHTLSDSLSSVFVVIGVKLSSKKADKEHPFGHGRWEQIVSIFIGFLLAIIAYEFLKDSVIEFKNKGTAHFGLIAIVVTIISVITKEALAQYAFYIARKTGNPSVKADGWHHRTDALSSLVVLTGIFLKDKFWWVDSVLGFIISLMLFYAVYEIVKEAINKLLGEEPNQEMIEKVNHIIRQFHNEDLRPHHFHIHNYGTHHELTFHIKLDGKTDIASGHKIATEIENRIYKDLKIESTIHIEPVNVEHRSD
jgi:cation diffusion facilitator family transporter